MAAAATGAATAAGEAHSPGSTLAAPGHAILGAAHGHDHGAEDAAALAAALAAEEAGAAPLLPARGAATAQRARFGVLAAFALCTFNQGLQWLTYSSVDPDRVRALLGPDRVSDATIALLLNWGPIMGVAVFPAQAYVLSWPGGFRLACALGILLCLLASMLRMAPAWLGVPAQRSDAALALAHVAQMLNAGAGALCMGSTARLSALWFPDRERTRATAAAIASNALGTNVAFVVGPALGLRGMFALSLGLSLASASTLAWLPRHPADGGPACAGGDDEEEEEDRGAARGCAQGLRHMLRDARFATLVLSAGVVTGVTTGWQSLFQTTLKGAFPEDVIGWLGFANGLAANLGTLAMGQASKRHRLGREARMGVAALLVAVELFAVARGYLGGAPWPAAGLGAVLVLAGLAYGAAQPLLYELAAQLAGPTHEGTAVGLLVGLLNLACFVFVAVSPGIAPRRLTVALLVAIALALAALAVATRRPAPAPARAEPSP